jgi:hypothetical protein
MARLDRAALVLGLDRHAIDVGNHVSDARSRINDDLAAVVVLVGTAEGGATLLVAIPGPAATMSRRGRIVVSGRHRLLLGHYPANAMRANDMSNAEAKKAVTLSREELYSLAWAMCFGVGSQPGSAQGSDHLNSTKSTA